MKVKYILGIYTAHRQTECVESLQFTFSAVKDFASQSTEALGGGKISPELWGDSDYSYTIHKP